MRGNAELAAWARGRSRGAAAIFVGSGHIREVLEEVVGVARVHEVPPGVDVENFRPEERDAALAALLAEPAATLRTPATGRSACPTRKRGAASRVLRRRRAVVVYFGKLLYNKGVHVLLEALRGLDARGVIVGFGDYRAELEALAPRRTSSSPARSSIATSSTCSRSRTWRSFPRFSRGVRHGRGRGRRGGVPAARRPPLGPGRDRGGAGGRLSAALPSPRVLRPRNAGDLARKLEELLALSPERPSAGTASRRARSRETVGSLDAPGPAVAGRLLDRRIVTRLHRTTPARFPPWVTRSRRFARGRAAPEP